MPFRERVIPPRLHAALRHPALGALLVYLVGIALRVRYTFDIHPPAAFVTSDMSFYVDLARRLLAQHGPIGPWDVTHPLGFPAFLALQLSHGGTLVQAGYAQLAVSCLVPGAVGLLAWAAFGRGTGYLAVGFASLYFPYIEYGALFLSEIHFTLWLSLAFAGFLGAINARRRWVSLVLGVAAYLFLAAAGWRSEIPNLSLATAMLAAMVAFAPVLSPQFLLWILPVSACAYGIGRENLVLLAALLFTQIALQNYDGVDGLTGSFVWPLAIRNVLLLVYLALVAWPIVRRPAQLR